jgi:hypothetical protein
MSKKINELIEINNNLKIESLTDEERQEWYFRIKSSLPDLKKLGPIDELEQAILEYEQKNSLL